MNRIIVLAALFSLLSPPASADVPNTFPSSGTGKAANENFEYLDDRVDNIQLGAVLRTADDIDGVASVSCAANELLTGGGCFCTGSPTAHESGRLFACSPNVYGDSYVAGCYLDYYDQTVTPVSVYALCAKVGDGVTASAASTKQPVPEHLDELLDTEQRMFEMIEEHRNTLPR